MIPLRYPHRKLSLTYCGWRKGGAVSGCLSRTEIKNFSS